jgi:hypothetical protein
VFGWFKKRLFALMESWVRRAHLATYSALRRDLGVNAEEPKADDAIRRMQAACRANFLMGSGPAELHKQDLDLLAEHAAALNWLRQDPIFCELVVQSLRVVHMISHGRGVPVTLPVLGEELLLEFGPAFPVAPSPDSYEELVVRAMKTLPHGDQVAIAQST